MSCRPLANGTMIPIQNGPRPMHGNEPTYSGRACRRAIRSHFPSPTSSSSPILKRSSRASDMGKRLAQERSKNNKLLQQIKELEHNISILQQGKHGNLITSHEFSSPSVATPLPFRPRNSSLENDLHSVDLYSMGHLHDLEDALQVETQQRHFPENQSSNLDDFDSSILKLIDQASELLSKDESHRNRKSNTEKTANSQSSMNLSRNEDRMREYYELVNGFHSEQKRCDDLHGEELIARQDILWLFQELQWRFEEIYIGYEERLKQEDETPANMEEWKACLEGLLEVVKQSMKQAPSSHHRNLRPWDNHATSWSPTNGTHHLQNEVTSLNRRLASFATQHHEICHSLYDDMEAMRRDYQEQIDNKSQCIQKLESKISEQTEYIAQIKKERQQDKNSVKEVKRKLALSMEGSAVRIRYLEGMLRLLQIDLKELETTWSKKGITDNGTPGTCRVEAVKEGRTPSTPVFLRDLTLAMKDVGPVHNNATLTDVTAVNHETNAKMGGGGLNKIKPSSNDAEITKLVYEVASLGNSLADSETRRAHLLDDFQQERRKYILQYKQISDILKQLTEEKISST